MGSDAVVRLLGWRGAALHGDPCIHDRWRWLKRRLEPGPVRTLDAGSGSGAFSFCAAKLGNEVLGVSLDEVSNASATRRAEILGIEKATFMDADLRALDSLDLGRFDQVICLETIEHIADDGKLVRDLASKLRPGGTIYLTTPSKSHRRLRNEEITEIEDGTHVRYGYEHETLERLFREAGIEPTESTYVSGYVSQKITNLYRRLPFNQYVSWALTLPLRPLQVFDRWLTDRLEYPYLCVGLVGRKT